MVGWDGILYTLWSLWPELLSVLLCLLREFSSLCIFLIVFCCYHSISMVSVLLGTPVIKSKSAAQTLFLLLQSPLFLLCNATSVLFVYAFLSLSLWSWFYAKTPCHSNNQQWCSCLSAKLITQKKLKHFYFCALNSSSDLVSWFVSLSLIGFALWVQLLIW